MPWLDNEVESRLITENREQSCLTVDRVKSETVSNTSEMKLHTTGEHKTSPAAEQKIELKSRLGLSQIGLQLNECKISYSKKEKSESTVTSTSETVRQVTREEHITSSSKVEIEVVETITTNSEKNCEKG